MENKEEISLNSKGNKTASKIGTKYAFFQLAKAFLTYNSAEDKSSKILAKERIEKWSLIIRRIENGAINMAMRAQIVSLSLELGVSPSRFP